MRSALRIKAAPRSRTTTVASIPAPVGGWNARDALASMKPQDAVDLENWFPQTSYVEIRGGSASHATGMTGNGKTLAVYSRLNGTQEMFALTPSGVYDVSSAGAVGPSKAARTNGKHQWVNFHDSGTNWLILCNGVDKPLYYDGTTWTAVDGVSSPALTGLTTTDIIHVNVYKGRLFFIEKEQLSFWYLAAGAAGGHLTEFSLEGVVKKGGFLMAMGTWTLDAGDGPDDHAAFITSEGEVAVYSGTNPGDANAWSLEGVYEIPDPLGRKCYCKLGGDMLLLTRGGAFPMAKALQSSAIDYRLAISDKINKAFTDAAVSYGNVFGWVPIVFPEKNALIVNVPQAEDGTHEQYVMNTITRSWCKFTDWDAEDFAVFNNELYFCDGTVVYKAWTGHADGPDNIVAYAKQAFNYFGKMGVQKHFKLFRPILAVDGNLSFLTDIDVDFAQDEIVGTANYSVVTGATWDVSLWDNAVWGSGLTVVKEWNTPAEYPGFCAAPKLKVATNKLEVQWMASDVVFETGGVV
ncbi:MAG: hypothetical protein FJY55_10195 [Betaproteobacteria bacterium]|nr:hypothetical protein [Betaproteobacteria bacterium]